MEYCSCGAPLDFSPDGVHCLSCGEQASSRKEVRMEKKAGRFTISLGITDELLSDLLCSAFEGGSNYWYWIERCVEPTEWRFDSDTTALESGKHWVQDYPLNPGGAVIITDVEEDGSEEWVLDDAALQKGLNIMSQKYLYHFSCLFNGSMDATTGDVFLQCCLFGEIVYG